MTILIIIFIEDYFCDKNLKKIYLRELIIFISIIYIYI